MSEYQIRPHKKGRIYFFPQEFFFFSLHVILAFKAFLS